MVAFSLGMAIFCVLGALLTRMLDEDVRVQRGLLAAAGAFLVLLVLVS